MPELFEVIAELRRTFRLQIPSFGRAGDGNIHVNVIADPGQPGELERAHQAERVLFERVWPWAGPSAASMGSGSAKIPFVPLQLSPEEIALMRRIKAAFDPHGILNPGKMLPDEGASELINNDEIKAYRFCFESDVEAKGP